MHTRALQRIVTGTPFAPLRSKAEMRVEHSLKVSQKRVRTTIDPLRDGQGQQTTPQGCIVQMQSPFCKVQRMGLRTRPSQYSQGLSATRAHGKTRQLVKRSDPKLDTAVFLAASLSAIVGHGRVSTQALDHIGLHTIGA